MTGSDAGWYYSSITLFPPQFHHSSSRTNRRRTPRLVLCGGTFNLIQLLGVVPQDLAPYRFLTIREPTDDPVVHFVPVQRGRVREVGLKEDIVHPDFIDQPSRRRLLEPVTRIDIAGEILGRQQLEIWSLFSHAVAHELVIERFEREGDPTYPALDRHEFNLRMARQHPRHDQVTYLDAVT